MDFLTIAATVVTTSLVPLFKELGKKALEEVSKKTGEEVFDKHQAILEKVKNLFIGDELTTLNLLAENPEDGKQQGRVESKLEDKLKANPNVAKEIDDLLKSISISQVKQNTMTITGDDSIGIQDIVSSKITITKK